VCACVRVSLPYINLDYDRMLLHFNWTALFSCLLRYMFISVNVTTFSGTTTRHFVVFYVNCCYPWCISPRAVHTCVSVVIVLSNSARKCAVFGTRSVYGE